MKKYVFIIFLLPIALGAQELLVPSVNEDYRDMRQFDLPYYLPAYAPHFSGKAVHYCAIDTSAAGFVLSYNYLGFLVNIDFNFNHSSYSEKLQYDSVNQLVMHSQIVSGRVHSRNVYAYDSLGKVISKERWLALDSAGTPYEAERWQLYKKNDSIHVISYYDYDTAQAVFNLNAKRWLYYSRDLLDSTNLYHFMLTDSNQLDSFFFEREYYTQVSKPYGYLESRLTKLHFYDQSGSGYAGWRYDWTNRFFDTLQTNFQKGKQSLFKKDTMYGRQMFEDKAWNNNGNLLTYQYHEPWGCYAAFLYEKLDYSYQGKELLSLSVRRLWERGDYILCFSTIVAELSKEELPASEIQVYPNPSNGVFKVKSLVRGNLSIYTLSGERVYSQKDFPAGENSIDLGHQKPGIYLLLLEQTDGLIEQEKLFLQ